VQGAANNQSALDDAAAPNDLTDYTFATASGQKDSLGIADTVAGTTVPAGYSIGAVIAAAWAARTNAGVASTLKLGTRASSGGTEAIGSAQALSTSFGPVMERQVLDPNGATWSEALVDSTQIVLESAGVYV
jgi:pimeloyl-ACP methyl ester carboxylesterase